MHLIHDLRNLLTVASVSVEHIQAATPTEVHRTPDLTVVAQCLDSMFEVVDEFFSDTVPVPNDCVDLGQVIADRAGMLRAAVGSAIDLRVEQFAADCTVMARPIDLERVLLNLVLNAAEAMPEGGVLTVQTKVIESPASDTGQKGPSPQSVRLTVSDTGRGMPREWEQQLFKRLAFDQTGGRGLGLASVNLIVLRLGGRFHAESYDLKGTRVHIDLPRARPWLPR